MDQEKLTEFLGKFVSDLGATMAAGSVVVGHRLGLYQALATGPATPSQLAKRTGTDTRYVTEWLAGQAAGGYVGYDASTGSYSMTPEQAFALADPNGPNLPAAFVLALGVLQAEPRITDGFRTGAGSAGTSTRRTSSPAPRPSSGPGTRPTWCRPGCPRWTASSTSSTPAGGSPTSAVAWAPRLC